MATARPQGRRISCRAPTSISGRGRPHLPRLRSGAVSAAGQGAQRRAEHSADPDRRCGFGQFGTFGGGVPSPTMDRLAAEGLRYNRFHTTALCSPTRAALITGRNHHSTSFAGITEAATGYDGYTLHPAEELRHGRRGAPPERLHDRVDRQEPQHADLGDERGRTVRPLGQRLRLRLLLRLQRAAT